MPADYNFSINSIARGNLRARRRQYASLAAGIVLAVFFTATAFLFASAMFTSLREQHYRRVGRQDAIIFNCQEAPLERLEASGVFSGYGTAAILGYVLPDGESDVNGFAVAQFDAAALAGVKTVTGEKVLRMKILADAVTPYVTGNSDWGFDYLSPEARDGNPELRPWQEREHLDYLASKARYGYTQDYLTVDCCAATVEVMEKLAPFVSAGAINLDQLNSGAEILLVAPAGYGIMHKEVTGHKLSFKSPKSLFYKGASRRSPL